MGKGHRYEREMANYLVDRDWAVVRAGGSGSGTEDDRPDLLAGNGTHTWAIEAKFASENNIYLDPGEVSQLVSFAERLGVQAVIAPRWNTREVDSVTADWYVVPPFETNRTPSGNYAMHGPSIAAEYPTLSAVVESSDPSDE